MTTYLILAIEIDVKALSSSVKKVPQSDVEQAFCNGPFLLLFSPSSSLFSGNYFEMKMKQPPCKPTGKDSLWMTEQKEAALVLVDCTELLS